MYGDSGIAAGPREAIREQALSVGFDAIGFAHPDVGPEAKKRLAQFLSDGWHGDMGWLEAKADRRADPLVLWPEARSVVALAMNYGPDRSPLDILDRKDRGAVSVYAQSRDYHEVVKKRLKRVARWIHQTVECEV